jgi:hypothetical protein
MTITLESLETNEHGRNKPVIIVGPLGSGKMTHSLQAIKQDAAVYVRIQASLYSMADFSLSSAAAAMMDSSIYAFHALRKESLGEKVALLEIEGLQHCRSDVAHEFMKAIETGKVNGHELGSNVVAVIDGGKDFDWNQEAYQNCQKVVFSPFASHLQSAKFLAQFATYDTRHDVVIGGISAVDPHFEKVTNFVHALNGVEGGPFGDKAVSLGITPEFIDTLRLIKDVKAANPYHDERLDDLCAAIDNCLQAPEKEIAAKSAVASLIKQSFEGFSR